MFPPLAPTSSSSRPILARLSARNFSASPSRHAAKPPAKSRGSASSRESGKGKVWDKPKKDLKIEPFVPFSGKLFSRLDQNILARVPLEPLVPATYPEFRPGIDKSSVGKVAQLGTSDSTNFLNAFGLPRNMLLDFRFSAKPTFVVRQATVDIVQRLKEAQETSSDLTRLVLHGRSGSGKSYVLHQAAQLCHMDKWIVLYIPRATKLVDGTTSYVYDSRTQSYMQHDFARETLRRLLLAQKLRLEDIRLDEATATTHAHLPLSTGATLASLVAESLQETAPAMDYLLAVIDALSLQTIHPVLLAIDEFQALWRRSEYRDPQFVRLHSYHLAFTRMLLEYANGTRRFTRGALLGALSVDLRIPVPIELIESLEMTASQPGTAYSPRRLPYVNYAEGLMPVEIPPLSLAEAASIFEMWGGASVLHTPKTDESFLSKFTESGGNARDFVWKGCLGTLET